MEQTYYPSLWPHRRVHEVTVTGNPQTQKQLIQAGSGVWGTLELMESRLRQTALVGSGAGRRPCNQIHKSPHRLPSAKDRLLVGAGNEAKAGLVITANDWFKEEDPGK